MLFQACTAGVPDQIKYRMRKGFHGYRWIPITGAQLIGRSRFWAVVWFGWLAFSAMAASSFTATLDRDTVALGETANLSLTFAEVKVNGVPNLPPVDGLNINYLSQSSEVKVLNGQFNQSFTFSYLVTPTRAGDFTIPALQFNLGRQILSSQAVKLKVVKDGSSAAPGAAPQPPKVAFLKLAVPKKEAYVGEVMPVDIQLYFQNIRDPQMPQLVTEGFLVGTNVVQAQSQTRQGNLVYNILSFKRSVMAVKAGELNLGPAECNLTVIVPVQGRRRGDPFDMLGDSFNDPFDMFRSRGEARPVKLSSDPVAIKVLPLPTENVPAGFSGAVGSYAMQATIGPTNVAVGDPITIKVQITGQGALDTLSLPPIDFGPDFKIYPATSKTQPTDQLGIEGTKNFEFVVIPQKADLKNLPAIQISYFDPAQKSYQTLVKEPVAITVRPSQAVVLPPSSQTSDGDRNKNQPQVDLVNIKSRPGRLGLIQPPLILQPRFLVIQGLPLVIWLLVYLRFKKLELWSRNPRLRRQRETDKILQAGRRDLRRQAQANDAGAFYATAFRLLQEQLGERLDLPASGITESVIHEHLIPRGGVGEAIGQLEELFHRCNQARYAASQMGGDLQAELARVDAVLRAVKNMSFSAPKK